MNPFLCQTKDLEFYYLTYKYRTVHSRLKQKRKKKETGIETLSFNFISQDNHLKNLTTFISRNLIHFFYETKKVEMLQVTGNLSTSKPLSTSFHKK